VESNEISVALMGEGEKPNILMHESAEGSLGVLKQIANDRNLFTRVVTEAYRICQFEENIDETVKATYQDLLTYYNQRDHHNINRFEIKEALAMLMACDSEPLNSGGRTYQEQYDWLLARVDRNSALEYRVLTYLYENGLSLPDAAQWQTSNPDEKLYISADFYYHPKICVFCDGSVHDNPEVQRADEAKRTALKDDGYQVVELYYKQDMWKSVVANRPDIFRKILDTRQIR
jgi:hypothetical protein